MATLGVYALLTELYTLFKNILVVLLNAPLGWFVIRVVAKRCLGFCCIFWFTPHQHRAPITTRSKQFACVWVRKLVCVHTILYQQDAMPTNLSVTIAHS